MDSELHRRCVNTIKGLSMDAVQAANSGHPGMPMGMADVATVLWTRFLRFDPSNPDWADRDRFVLSAGHGSMLQYSVLHLSGYDVSLDDIKAFRQWHSKTPGHPEVGDTPGVETTTGPLGQGIGNAVGMAMGERLMRETFGTELCDHRTFVICGDGDLMEGIATEAASIAGHLGLGRLVVLYDDNKISIDGSTDITFTENIPAKFEAMGWHTSAVDGHTPQDVERAIDAALAVTDRPSLIACRTTIGQGSPSKEGTSATHGAPLGVDEVAATKKRLGMDPDEHFAVPTDVKAAFCGAAATELREAWDARLGNHPRRDEFRNWVSPDWEDVAHSIDWPTFEAGGAIATRKASQAALKAIAQHAPNLVGGSADLAGSNGTSLGGHAFAREQFSDAQTIHFGVREHAMGAICNGLSLHGGVRPFNATFLVFHDYQRPAVRLSALMKQPVLYIYSHDSIFLGEDGPTHQPVATLLSLRALPGVDVWRPADAHETVACWQQSLLRADGPSALILSRQNLPILPMSDALSQGVARGGYVASDADGDAQVVLLGTGSEVALCLDAQKLLAERGVQARVVSLPCRERFHAQSAAYKSTVTPDGIPRLSVEAGLTLGWERWTGDNGDSVGIDTYGASAPASVLAEKFGFTAEHVADRAAALVR